jgi:HlyD family secretion protein
VATARNIASRYEPLVRSGAVSEVQLLEARNKAQEIATQLAEEERESLRLQAQLRSTRSGPNADLRGRIEANIRQIAEQDAKISTAQQQLLYGEIRSPATGRIFDLDVRKGSVAQAAQPLLRVVPYDALQAKVYVSSNVIGFIHPGQRADLSLDTFPAGDYGRIDAIVATVSTDALTPEKQKEALGTEATGLHYPATLTLKRQTLQAGNKQIALQPGMSLSADVQLRQRRMLSVVTGFFEDKLRNLERMR